MGDITYIPTKESWLYLAIVKNLCSPQIVGCSYFSRIDTALTLQSLDIAVRHRKPSKEIIFHSDQGVQYASETFHKQPEIY